VSAEEGFGFARAVPQGHFAGDAALKKMVRDTPSPMAGSPRATPTVAAPSGAPPSLRKSFPGPAFSGWYPPDPNLAAGPNQIVVVVNEKIAVYSKAGTRLGTERQLYSFFGRPSSVQSVGGVFDPKVAYDPWGKRFILVALESDRSTYSTYHLAVSRSSTASSDPAQWRLYRLDARKNGSTTSDTWADYPGLGFDRSGAIFITSNQFSLASGEFAYSRIRVLRKSQLYGGARTISWKDFWNMKNADGTKAFGIQPVHILSSANREWLVNTAREGGSAVTLWRVTGSTTSNPVLTRIRAVPIQPYALPPDAAQSGGPARIDTGDCRIMNAVYANGAIWTTFAHAWNFDGDGDTESAVRWLALSPATGAPTRDYVYGFEDAYLFWPGIGVSATGASFLVFGNSSASLHPGASYAGWRGADPEPTLTGVLKAGTAYYDLAEPPPQNRVRWGDYAGIARDPVLGSVWIFHEYAVPNASLGAVWATRIGRIAF
jgi:hypothetical protein